MTVRGLGLVEHPVPRDLVAIARGLDHSKEESPALDLDAYDTAAIVNSQRRSWKAVLFTAVERHDEAIFADRITSVANLSLQFLYR